MEETTQSVISGSLSTREPTSVHAQLSNLPIPLTNFIGREREIVEVRRLLSRSRLVTLTGAGGVGKTRLALQVIRDLAESYDDGVWFVELAPLADPDLVPQAVGSVLSVREQSGQPILQSLLEYLRSKNLLLVLDNCEHVISACARLADALLRACPNLRILATSREALGITGESAWTVPSLSLPNVRQQLPSFAELSQFEAVQLFVERAVAVEPRFRLTELNGSAVAHVCRRLDGIPLAIELAAARAKVLQPAEIAARLEDRFSLLTLGSRTALPRHQTLGAAIDWSYELLTEPERVLLRRLSVFAGGCTLEAAESVCPDELTSQPRSPAAKGKWGIGGISILDLVSHLVDKSLVIVDKQGAETRYHMLETIRQYALGRLEQSGEAEAIRRRHAEFLLGLAEQVPSIMTSAERKARYRRFDVEQDNLRAAMAWALEARRTEIGLRMVGALGDYWFWWASRWNEGWTWISQFLALPDAVQPKRARAYALRAAVNLLHYWGEHAEANRLADESLALFRELGDKSGMAWVLVDKGWNTFAPAESNKGESFTTESLKLFREIGDQRGIAMALWVLAAPNHLKVRPAEAAAMLEEGITAAQAAGDDAIAGSLYAALGVLAYHSGDYARADKLLRKGMELFREGGDADGVMDVLGNLAVNSLAQGDIELAASQLEAVEQWCRQYQHRPRLAVILSWLGYVRHVQGDDDAAGAFLREAVLLQQEQRHNLLLVKSLELCAWTAADSHQPQRAARLFGAAEAARERIGSPAFSVADKLLYDRHLTRARSELDKVTFDAAWSEGRAMTLEQATEYALETLVSGKQVIEPQPSRRAARQKFGGLTEREREIAARIAQGESNREIAEALVVSERTVETHVTNILNKLGFTSRAQVRKWAIEKGLAKQNT